MIKELVVLADELDGCNEKDAANFVDNLIKTAIVEIDEEEDPPLTPLIPEDEEFGGEQTKVDFVSKTGKELVARLTNFFIKKPDPMKWTNEERAKVVDAMEVFKI